MKICNGCGVVFDGLSWECPCCHAIPLKIGGFPAFDPILVESNSGFEPEFFPYLADIESKNFWFCARNRLLIWLLKKYFVDAKTLLEVGCGTGFVLSAIEKELPQIEVFGSEIHIEGLDFAAKRLKNTKLFQMDARRIPFENEFDVIGAFDVLEHIEEDEQVISQIYRALREYGGVIITVPQHAFLWSRVDEYSCHMRRYSAVELKGKVERAGFKVIRMTSFVTLLFPFMMLSRFAKKYSKKNYDVMKELELGNLMNRLFERLLGVEQSLIQHGICLPFGGSLVVVAKKV